MQKIKKFAFPYPKLKKNGVFENSGHVTYLQIYEFKNLRIYDVLNELLTCLGIGQYFSGKHQIKTSLKLPAVGIFKVFTVGFGTFVLLFSSSPGS